MATSGLYSKWVAACPLRYTSPNAPAVADVLGTSVLAILNGAYRYAHVSALRGDQVNPPGLGMAKVVSEDSLRRAFQDEEPHALREWQAAALLETCAPALEQPWIADLNTAPQTDLAAWRFRAWARLVRELGWQNESHIILGVTSARAGEGRTTLIRHLRDAARDRQLPVLTVTNAALPDAGVRRVALAEALTTPELVHRHWREQAGVPLELHHDGGWKWSLEERARWQRAVESWRAVSQLALLVELPPMAQIDAVLAAEMLPAVVWVTASGMLEQRELAATLETVRAGEVNVAAAILNRERSLFGSVPWLRRLGLALLAGLLLLQAPVLAATTNAIAASPKVPPSNPTGLFASDRP